MDDNVCREYTRVGKFGRLGRVCRECECASTLESVKVRSRVQTCQTRANSQLLVIILLTAGLARGLEVNLNSYFSDNSTIYVHSDLIVDYLVIIMLNFQTSKYVKFMILPVALST